MGETLAAITDASRAILMGLWADGGPTKLVLQGHDVDDNGVVHLAYGPASDTATQ
jgi:hypothetical protein